MKLILLSTLSVVLTMYSFSQEPQYAVVRPNGETLISTTFAGAHQIANDGDAIYLPATLIKGSLTITKKLRVIGTGHNPMTTIASGITRIETGITTTSENVILENIVTNVISINGNSNAVRNCNIGLLGFFAGAALYIDRSIIDALGSNTCTANSNVVIKNSFFRVIENLSGASFFNCISMNNPNLNSVYNIAFFNCVFGDSFQLGNNQCSNQLLTFHNNIFASSSVSGLGDLTIGGNFLGVSPSQIFTKITTANFNYGDDYNLKPGSPYLTAGTDGTQIGIYGGTSPWRAGSLPSNPSIYFKKVDANSSSDGKLKVEYKVLSGN